MTRKKTDKGNNMAKNKNPNIKLVTPPTLEEIRQKRRRMRTDRIKRIITFTILAAMTVYGTYLLVTSHPYTSIHRVGSYKKETSDSNHYQAFGNGIVRYSRDGVAFLNYQNEEQWIQPGQFQNPIIDTAAGAFAVADNGGNTIQVFTEKGLKGEIETTLPIEKISVSDQGIVSTILRNDTSPQVITYDAAGNILVENQVSTNTLGYPVALEMSPDGTVLMTSYLYTKAGSLKARVVYYNFGEKGKSEKDHIVGMEEFSEAVIPEVYFINKKISVAVSDHSFIVYEGAQAPAKKVEVQIDQQIKSAFHSDRYIGFVLLNQEKSGYEVRLYNTSGREVMNRTINGEYENVEMVGNEIILYEGSRCCIITNTGIQRYKGDLRIDALAVIPAFGLNRYYIMGTDELREIYLTK